MLIKLDVSIEYLSRPARRALNPVEKVFQEYGEEAVITSTNGGVHSPSSLHYVNDAFDVRKAFVKNKDIVICLKARLGNEYDIVLESNHIHIEFDPKSKENK